MNCEICRNDLEDLLYGEVDTAWKITLHEHLSECADCRAALSQIEREDELFAQYYKQNSIEPSEEMWQVIRNRIQPQAPRTETLSLGWTERFRNWFGLILAPTMLRQAGFAALLILISVGLTTLYFTSRKATNDDIATQTSPPSPTALRQPSPPEQTLPQPTPALNLPTPNFRESVKRQVAALKPPAPKTETKVAQPKLSEDQLLAQQIAKASREYQSAITLLERTIAKRRTQLDEGTVKQFEGSLAMIDASIASSRAALRAHPNDPAAARFLLAAYSKKVELMQEIAMR